MIRRTARTKTSDALFGELRRIVQNADRYAGETCMRRCSLVDSGEDVLQDTDRVVTKMEVP